MVYVNIQEFKSPSTTAVYRMGGIFHRAKFSLDHDPLLYGNFHGLNGCGEQIFEIY